MASPWGALALVAIVAVLPLVVLWLWCRRPHLPRVAPAGALSARFAGERETMFVPLLQRLGLTTEFEG
jgi:hypothetical protein